MTSSFLQVAILFVIKCLTTTGARPQSRLTLADEWSSYYYPNHDGPGTYAFGYDLEDPMTGNIQFRQEEKYSNGTVVGSYGHVEPDGNVRITHYVADDAGYRVTVENRGKSVQYPPETNRDDFTPDSPQMAAAQTSLMNKSPKEEIRIPPKYREFNPRGNPTYANYGFDNLKRTVQ